MIILANINKEAVVIYSPRQRDGRMDGRWNAVPLDGAGGSGLALLARQSVSQAGRKAMQGDDDGI